MVGIDAQRLIVCRPFGFDKMCPPGQFMTGFDGQGNIKCEPATVPPPATHKQVFILSDTSDGNLGGVAGADTRCQDAAGAAGLSGIFLAWIADSDPASAPASRFVQAAVPYQNVLGQVIANNWADLTDGSLIREIDTDENGVVVLPTFIPVTNVEFDGTQADFNDHCNDWSSNSVSLLGVHGDENAVTTAWTNSGFEDCFLTQLTLYCFEQ